MISNEFFSTIKLRGIESGVIEIRYALSDFIPTIIINFYDEDTGVSYGLDSILLGEFCPIKESYVIGSLDLQRIKNSKEADIVKKLIIEKANELEAHVLTKAKEFANEITERVNIPMEIVTKIQGKSQIITESSQNMWHASQVLQGIDDDY